MASCHVSLPLLAVLASLCGAAVAQRGELFGPFSPTCSTTSNYTDSSLFKKNLEQLLSSLSSSAAGNGWFQTSTVGTGADKVFGLIMCYADSNAAQCLDCLTWAPATITTTCQGSRNVSAVYGACLLRYSDTHFFREEVPDGPSGVIWAFLPYTTDMDTMVVARSRMTCHCGCITTAYHTWTRCWGRAWYPGWRSARKTWRQANATGAFQCTLHGR
jgi:hypothetical protein